MADADLYAVLGLKKECSDADLRLAYRRLAMTWHPDRCSASGSSARVQGCNKRCSSAMGSGTPPRASRPGSGPGRSGSSSKGSDLRRREEAPWKTTTQEDTSIGGRKKKQRPSTGHGESS